MVLQAVVSQPDSKISSQTRAKMRQEKLQKGLQEGKKGSKRGYIVVKRGVGEFDVLMQVRSVFWKLPLADPWCLSLPHPRLRPPTRWFLVSSLGKEASPKRGVSSLLCLFLENRERNIRVIATSTGAGSWGFYIFFLLVHSGLVCACTHDMAAQLVIATEAWRRPPCCDHGTHVVFTILRLLLI